MSSTKQLLEKANRKCEMRWRVFAFDPTKDNELVHTSKDAFDCIKMAGEYKMDLAKKHPDYIIEIIAESKEQKKTDTKVFDIDFSKPDAASKLQKFKQEGITAFENFLNKSNGNSYLSYTIRRTNSKYSNDYVIYVDILYDFGLYENQYKIEVTEAWSRSNTTTSIMKKIAKKPDTIKQSIPIAFDKAVKDAMNLIKTNESSQKNEDTKTKTKFLRWSKLPQVKAAIARADKKAFLSLMEEFNDTEDFPIVEIKNGKLVFGLTDLPITIDTIANEWFNDNTLFESSQKNEAKEYKLYKLKKIGGDKVIQDIYPATSIGDALRKRINLRKKNDGFLWEIFEIENGKGKLIDSTDHYTDEFIKNNFKGDHYRNKESTQKNEEKEFTIKLVTPFGKAKVCSWKANSVDAAVKEFLDANPAYRENKKGAVIAESSQKNETGIIEIEPVTSITQRLFGKSEFRLGEYTITMYPDESRYKNGIPDFSNPENRSWTLKDAKDWALKWQKRYPGKYQIIVAESSQKNEALNLDSLTDVDAKQLIQHLQDFIKDKSSKYYHIDKIETILKKKYKAESISDDIVREVKEEVKDGVKDLVQQDVDAKLNGEVTPADYQATYGEDIDDDSDSIFGDELDNVEPDEPEQTNESIDEASLKDFLKSEHSMALKKIKNMAADDPSSFYKGYATAIHNVQRKFSL